MLNFVLFVITVVIKCHVICRFANVQPDGKYVTDVKNDGARFNVTIAALIGCRISLCFQAVAAIKVRASIDCFYLSLALSHL